jgi:hypothetical protein
MPLFSFAYVGIDRISQIDTMRTNTPTCPAAAAAASPVSPPLPACPGLARVRHGGGKSVGLRVAFFRGLLFEYVLREASQSHHRTRLVSVRGIFV